MSLSDDLTRDITDLTRGNGITASKMRSKKTLMRALGTNDPEVGVKALVGVVDVLEDHREASALRNALGVDLPMKDRSTLDSRRHGKQDEASRNTLIKRERAAITNVAERIIDLLDDETKANIMRDEDTADEGSTLRPIDINSIRRPDEPHGEPRFMSRVAKDLSQRELLEDMYVYASMYMGSVDKNHERLIESIEALSEKIDQLRSRIDDLEKRRKLF